MAYAHPLKGWFWLDVVSCLPVAYITQIAAALDSSDGGGDEGGGGAAGGNVKILKVLRLLRLAKLLRLGRVHTLMKRHEERFEEILAAGQMFLVMLALAYGCHLGACGWYLVGGDEENEETGIVVEGWITRRRHDAWMWHSESVGLGTRYLAAYSWAVGIITTIGINDISGHTTYEQLYTILAELISCLLYAKIVGFVGASMVGHQLLTQKVKSQVVELREFMTVKGIPSHLRQQIRRYMEHLYTQKTGFDEKLVLQQLPPKLAADLLQHLYRDIIVDTWLCKNIRRDHAAISDICGKLMPYQATSNRPIYEPGDIGEEIYCIVDDVEVKISFGADDKQPHETKRKGGLFGEGCLTQLFSGSTKNRVYKRNRRAEVSQDCELRYLTVRDIKHICERHGEVEAEIRKLHKASVFNQDHDEVEILMKLEEISKGAAETSLTAVNKFARPVLSRSHRSMSKIGLVVDTAASFPVQDIKVAIGLLVDKTAQINEYTASTFSKSEAVDLSPYLRWLLEIKQRILECIPKEMREFVKLLDDTARKANPDDRILDYRDLNRDPNKRTAMMTAALQGRIKLFQILMELGADPCLLDKDGHDCEVLAARAQLAGQDARVALIGICKQAKLEFGCFRVRGEGGKEGLYAFTTEDMVVRKAERCIFCRAVERKPATKRRVVLKFMTGQSSRREDWPENIRKKLKELPEEDRKLFVEIDGHYTMQATEFDKQVAKVSQRNAQVSVLRGFGRPDTKIDVLVVARGERNLADVLAQDHVLDTESDWAVEVGRTIATSLWTLEKNYCVHGGVNMRASCNCLLPPAYFFCSPICSELTDSVRRVQAT